MAGAGVAPHGEPGADRESKAGDDVVVIFLCGLALSLLQSVVLAYFVLSLRDTFAFSAVHAGRPLILAHLGGAAGRLGSGVVSDRLLGAHRRPRLAINR